MDADSTPTQSSTAALVPRDGESSVAQAADVSIPSPSTQTRHFERMDESHREEEEKILIASAHERRSSQVMALKVMDEERDRRIHDDQEKNLKIEISREVCRAIRGEQAEDQNLLSPIRTPSARPTSPGSARLRVKNTEDAESVLRATRSSSDAPPPRLYSPGRGRERAETNGDPNMQRLLEINVEERKKELEALVRRSSNPDIDLARMENVVVVDRSAVMQQLIHGRVQASPLVAKLRSGIEESTTRLSRSVSVASSQGTEARRSSLPALRIELETHAESLPDLAYLAEISRSPSSIDDVSSSASIPDFTPDDKDNLEKAFNNLDKVFLQYAKKHVEPNRSFAEIRKENSRLDRASFKKFLKDYRIFPGFVSKEEEVNKVFHEINASIGKEVDKETSWNRARLTFDLFKLFVASILGKTAQEQSFKISYSPGLTTNFAVEPGISPSQRRTSHSNIFSGSPNNYLHASPAEYASIGRHEYDSQSETSSNYSQPMNHLKRSNSMEIAGTSPSRRNLFPEAVPSNRLTRSASTAAISPSRGISSRAQSQTFPSPMSNPTNKTTPSNASAPKSSLVPPKRTVPSSTSPRHLSLSPRPKNTTSLSASSSPRNMRARSPPERITTGPLSARSVPEKRPAQHMRKNSSFLEQFGVRRDPQLPEGFVESYLPSMDTNSSIIASRMHQKSPSYSTMSSEFLSGADDDLLQLRQALGMEPNSPLPQRTPSNRSGSPNTSISSLSDAFATNPSISSADSIPSRSSSVSKLPPSKLPRRKSDILSPSSSLSSLEDEKNPFTHDSSLSLSSQTSTPSTSTDSAPKDPSVPTHARRNSKIPILRRPSMDDQAGLLADIVDSSPNNSSKSGANSASRVPPVAETGPARRISTSKSSERKPSLSQTPVDSTRRPSMSKTATEPVARRPSLSNSVHSRKPSTSDSSRPATTSDTRRPSQTQNAPTSADKKQSAATSSTTGQPLAVANADDEFTQVNRISPAAKKQAQKQDHEARSEGALSELTVSEDSFANPRNSSAPNSKPSSASALANNFEEGAIATPSEDDKKAPESSKPKPVRISRNPVTTYAPQGPQSSPAKTSASSAPTHTPSHRRQSSSGSTASASLTQSTTKRDALPSDKTKRDSLSSADKTKKDSLSSTDKTKRDSLSSADTIKRDSLSSAEKSKRGSLPSTDKTTKRDSLSSAQKTTKRDSLPPTDKTKRDSLPSTDKTMTDSSSSGDSSTLPPSVSSSPVSSLPAPLPATSDQPSSVPTPSASSEKTSVDQGAHTADAGDNVKNSDQMKPESAAKNQRGSSLHGLEPATMVETPLIKSPSGAQLKPGQSQVSSANILLDSTDANEMAPDSKQPEAPSRSISSDKPVRSNSKSGIPHSASGNAMGKSRIPISKSHSRELTESLEENQDKNKSRVPISRSRGNDLTESLEDKHPKRETKIPISKSSSKELTESLEDVGSDQTRIPSKSKDLNPSTAQVVGSSELTEDDMESHPLVTSGSGIPLLQKKSSSRQSLTGASSQLNQDQSPDASLAKGLGKSTSEHGLSATTAQKVPSLKETSSFATDNPPSTSISGVHTLTEETPKDATVAESLVSSNSEDLVANPLFSGLSALPLDILPTVDERNSASSSTKQVSSSGTAAGVPQGEDTSSIPSNEAYTEKADKKTVSSSPNADALARSETPSVFARQSPHPQTNLADSLDGLQQVIEEKVDLIENEDVKGAGVVPLKPKSAVSSQPLQNDDPADASTVPSSTLSQKPVKSHSGVIDGASEISSKHPQNQLNNDSTQQTPITKDKPSSTVASTVKASSSTDLTSSIVGEDISKEEKTSANAPQTDSKTTSSTTGSSNSEQVTVASHRPQAGLESDSTDQMLLHRPDAAASFASVLPPESFGATNRPVLSGQNRTMKSAKEDKVSQKAAFSEVMSGANRGPRVKEVDETFIRKFKSVLLVALCVYVSYAVAAATDYEMTQFPS